MEFASSDVFSFASVLYPVLIKVRIKLFFSCHAAAVSKDDPKFLPNFSLIIPGDTSRCAVKGNYSSSDDRGQ